MTDEPRVRVGKAKGRPMLQWVGKRPLREVRAFPAQLVERFASEGPDGAVADVDWSDWPDRFDRGGLLFHGDNKEVLAYLLAHGFRGKVDLVYIDPPFDSGADYVRKVQLRGASGSVRMEGELHTLGEQIQYTDIWANDTYLQFMYERVLLVRELMAEEASIYVHCDWRRTMHLRYLMDEVFGSENFLNEVIWYFPNKLQGNVNRFATNHNNLLLYAKSKDAYAFHRIEEERDKPIRVNRRFWDATEVRFEPADGGVLVTIDDFISPSILERLSSQEGVLNPQITDWRAMVDSVFIDAAYDGEVFNVAVADIPERRQDLVEGTYRLERPEGSQAPVAVRITDMLGEEVLVLEPRQ